MQSGWGCCCDCKPLVVDSFTVQAHLDGSTIIPDVVDLSLYFNASLSPLGVQGFCVKCTRWRLIETGFDFWYAGWQQNVSPDCAPANGGFLDANMKIILGDFVAPTPGAAGLIVQAAVIDFHDEYLYPGFMSLQIGCCDDKTGRITWPS